MPHHFQSYFPPVLRHRKRTGMIFIYISSNCADHENISVSENNDNLLFIGIHALQPVSILCHFPLSPFETVDCWEWQAQQLKSSSWSSWAKNWGEGSGKFLEGTDLRTVCQNSPFLSSPCALLLIHRFFWQPSGKVVVSSAAKIIWAASVKWRAVRQHNSSLLSFPRGL